MRVCSQALVLGALLFTVAAQADSLRPKEEYQLTVVDKGPVGLYQRTFWRYSPTHFEIVYGLDRDGRMRVDCTEPEAHADSARWLKIKKIACSHTELPSAPGKKTHVECQERPQVFADQGLVITWKYASDDFSSASLITLTQNISVTPGVYHYQGKYQISKIYPAPDYSPDAPKPPL
jgi:hypothetical protein